MATGSTLSKKVRSTEAVTGHPLSREAAAPAVQRRLDEDEQS